MPPQSVLVMLVPEAEPLVGSFRSKYDSSAADGMGAHITINYPFLLDAEVTPDIIESLRVLFSRSPSFSFSLISVRRFPGALYLAPVPDQPFKDLIQAVPTRFPQSPPYGGLFPDVIPHLTVAAIEDGAELERISRQFADACDRKLPIACTAREVWLMDNKPGRWTKRIAFPLAECL